jgi:TetR/AcrR family transcriptional regulator, transcriptional repressor for nem operon
VGTGEQIVDAADRLFYEQGFERTSFAAIAETVGISRGNFYYHFKTKDEILEAVIDTRLASTRRMLADWSEGSTSPLDRVRRFVDIVITNSDDIERYGCPVGTLTSELAKIDHTSRSQAVGVFEMFRTWLRRQFEELGYVTEADDFAMHVLTVSQGVATLSNAFHDSDFVRREVEGLNDWLTWRLGAHRSTRSGR